MLSQPSNGPGSPGWGGLPDEEDDELKEVSGSDLGEAKIRKTAVRTQRRPQLTCQTIRSQRVWDDCSLRTDKVGSDTYRVERNALRCKASSNTRRGALLACDHANIAAGKILGEQNTGKKWPTPKGHVDALSDPEVRAALEQQLDLEFNQIQSVNQVQFKNLLNIIH